MYTCLCWHNQSIRFLAILTVMAACGLASAQTAPVTVSPQLFNMSMNGGVISQQPWPTATFTGIRVFGDGTTWREINTSRGVYDWSSLDLWLENAGKHGNDVLYTFADTPQWASSKPGDSSCSGSDSVGSCDPPYDLNADGSGTDEVWKTYVTALVLHNKNSKGAHIKYWEMWNEPYNAWEFTGTYAQMVRMVRDARYVIKKWDPTAVVLTPTLNWNTQTALNWAAGYLAAGGADFADAVALHGYVFGSTPQGEQTDNPETFMTLLPPFKKVLANAGMGSKQIINTEASWGVTANWNYGDPDKQAAFVARLYLFNAAYGISRLYWFEWNNDAAGALWVPSSGAPSAPGTMLKSGIAYEQIYSWLVGKTIANGCSASGTVWSCSITGANGYQAELIWDTAESCSNGDCSTVLRAVDPKYIKYRTISGTTVNITGTTAPVGLKPILLENQ